MESIVELGEPAVDPLLELLGEMDAEDAGDVPFVLAALRVRDARILEALTRRLENDPQDAALCLEIYGDPAAIPALEAALAQIPADDPRSRAPMQAVIEGFGARRRLRRNPDETFDIWALYPAEAAPDFGALEDEDRLAMLEKGSASLRADVALSYQGTDLSDEVRARLIQLAKTDPDPTVRGACWEALGEIGDEPELRQAMLKVLADPKAASRRKIRRGNRPRGAIRQCRGLSGDLESVPGAARPRQSAQSHGAIVRQAVCRLSAQAPG